MKRLLLAVGLGLGLLFLFGGTPPAEATNGPKPEKCYEQLEQAQYRKFTAPTDAGPWTLYGTWWKGQTNAWHADVGEVAEGPGNHPDGRYTYRKVAERTIDGKRIECPPPPTTIPPTTLPPETTVPPTTEPPTTTTPPETAEPPSTTTPPTTTLPPEVVEQCPDPANPYPQNYGTDAPCGPTDPCVAIDPDTGMGTTLWHVVPCGTPIEQPPTEQPPATPATPGELPSTGSEVTLAAIAAAVLAAGLGIVRLSRRPTA